MPNKLPELYLYRLIPGAKQPSRWNIKSRYPVPVVPPAPPSDQNLDNDELLAIDEPTAPGKPTLTIIGSPTIIFAGLLLWVSAPIRVTFARNTGGSSLKTLNAYMMVDNNNNKPVATINRSITPSELLSGYAIETLQAYIYNGATVDLTASVVNVSDNMSDVSNSVSFLATLREFYRSKNY